MRLQTILNKIHPIKGFKYDSISTETDSSGSITKIVAHIKPKATAKPRCSSCGNPSSGYDTNPKPRVFQFIPLFNIPLFFSYFMRRVQCKHCNGVKTEAVPWATGKQQSCDVFRKFLSSWARRLSWKETAGCFNVSWNSVRRSVEWIVEYGRKHRSLEDVESIGVDEVTYSKGHRYMTLVYQMDNGRKRLLEVVEKRREKSLEAVFNRWGEQRCAEIKIVCSDMWKPYLNVIARMLPNALNILDRFHIAKKLNDAVDEVRKKEAKQLAAEGYEPILKNARYCFLKRLINLTETQGAKLKELLQYNLKSVRAYLLKEAFDGFWEYNSPYWAKWYLEQWCKRTMRSRLDPMKKVVKMLRKHEDLLMNYFVARKKYSSGVVEGLNLKVNLCMRRAYGYKSFELLEVSLYHQLGELPEPKFTHEFC